MICSSIILKHDQSFIRTIIKSTYNNKRLCEKQNQTKYRQLTQITRGRQAPDSHNGESLKFRIGVELLIFDPGR